LGDASVVIAAGSAARVQQPQVTHVGGQLPSSVPGSSKMLHGSVTTTLDSPDALSVSMPTTMARARRRTP
jgi:hypothetical protein